jgi:hypothetical protein
MHNYICSCLGLNLQIIVNTFLLIGNVLNNWTSSKHNMRLKGSIVDGKKEVLGSGLISMFQPSYASHTTVRHFVSLDAHFVDHF